MGMICRTCKLRPAVAKGECKTCSEYRRRHGEERPADKLDTPRRLALYSPPRRAYLSWSRAGS